MTSRFAQAQSSWEEPPTRRWRPCLGASASIHWPPAPPRSAVSGGGKITAVPPKRAGPRTQRETAGCAGPAVQRGTRGKQSCAGIRLRPLPGRIPPGGNPPPLPPLVPALGSVPARDRARPRRGEPPTGPIAPPAQPGASAPLGDVHGAPAGPSARPAQATPIPAQSKRGLARTGRFRLWGLGSAGRRPGFGVGEGLRPAAPPPFDFRWARRKHNVDLQVPSDCYISSPEGVSLALARAGRGRVGVAGEGKGEGAAGD